MRPFLPIRSLIASTSVVALIASGSVLASSAPAGAVVTALTYTNATQTVTVGTAMQSAVATATGSPYVPQFLGTAETWLGPNTAGTPTFPYTFPSGTNPTGMLQGDVTFNHDVFFLETGGTVSGNTVSELKRVDRATGTVTTQTITNMQTYSAGPVQMALLNGSSRFLAMDAADRLYVNFSFYYAVGTAGCTSPAPFCMSQQVLRLENTSGTSDWAITGAMRLPGGDATSSTWPAIPTGITVTASGDIIYLAGNAAPGVTGYSPGALYSLPAGSVTANPANGLAADLVSSPLYAAANWGSLPRGGLPSGISFNPSNQRLVMLTSTGTVLQTSGAYGSLGTTADLIADDVTLGQISGYSNAPAWDSTGNMYFGYSNCVKYIGAATFSTPPGTPVVPPNLGGSCGASGFVNGVGSVARFAFAGGSFARSAFAFDSQSPGMLLMTDPGNRAIRRIGTIGYAITPALQTGVTMASNGTISGTPSLTGLTTSNNVQTHTVSYRNLDLTEATATVTLTYVAPPSALAYSNSPQNSAAQNVAITTMSPTQTAGSGVLGIPAPTYTISPSLPSGVSINAGSGAISGTPTASMLATTFTVTATNAHGATTATVQLGVLAPGPPPGVPGTPSATVTSTTSATVTIVAPASGGAVVSYTVTASGGGGQTCTVTSPATSCVVTGLTAGAAYTFTSSATNLSGTSGASPASSTIALAVPGNPGAPTAVAGQQSATVTVTPPSGGGTPTTYLVTSAPAGGSCTVSAPATSCVVSGLAAGTSYTFTSTATNGAGTSSASPASNAVVPTSGGGGSGGGGSGGGTGGGTGSGSGQTGSPSTQGSVPSTPPSSNPSVLPTGGAGAVAQVGGAPVAISTASLPSGPANPSANGSTITGPGFTANLAGPAQAPVGSSVAPVTIIAGQRLQVGGSGFAPGSTVAVYSMPSGVIVGTTTVTSGGTISAALAWPAGSPLGAGGLQIAGFGPTGASIIVGVGTVVASAAAPVPLVSSTVLPSPPAGGAYVRLGSRQVPATRSASNTSVSYAAGESRARLEAVGPDGASLPISDGTVLIDASGAVKVAGSGMAPGTWVDLWFFSTPIYVGRVQVRPDGTYGGALPVPAGLMVGRHTVQSVATTKAGATLATSVGVRVASFGAVKSRRANAQVLFSPLSSTLSPTAHRTLARLVARTGKDRIRTIVVGFVQGSRSTANDGALSEARARVVASALKGLGLTGPYVVRGNGIARDRRGADARRVDISVTYRR